MSTTPNSFEALGIQTNLIHALSSQNITVPTPVQAATLPILLKGEDLLASAQTGTGKTIAYVLPILQHLLNTQTDSALILAPTRELALQIKTSIISLVPKQSRLFTTVLIGGESMHKQIIQLKRKPRIIVATPGRLNDHLNRKSVTLKNTKFLVLDETDRMLDMGFTPQLESICEYLPDERQTLMFSATMPKNISELSSKYLSNPKRVKIGQDNTAVENIKQTVVHIAHKAKTARLLDELDEREGSVIVFVKTKRGAEDLAKTLSNTNYPAKAIHGDLKQSQRTRVVQGFRKQTHRVMVATDVAARGLDVPHIQHVINYDLPQCPEDYIHRIGRTGRAGASGEALCFVSPAENHLWRAIDRLMNPNSKQSSGERGERKPHGKQFKGKKFGKKAGNNSRASKQDFFKNKKSHKPSKSKKSSFSQTIKDKVNRTINKAFNRKQPA